MNQLRFSFAIVLAIAVSGAAAQQPKKKTSNAWELRVDGIGPVSVGMSLPQLNNLLNEKFAVPTEPDEKDCFYVSTAAHPHVSFMIESGRVSRVDVNRPEVPSDRGARVGDSENEIRKIYGSKMKTEPHAYSAADGGHYLTFRSGQYAIRFETEKGKVRSMYSGRYPAVQYIEGCL
jgi:hypothetical protein